MAHAGQCFPICKTVRRRFQQWCKCGALWEILTQLANTLREECEIGVREDIIDATFLSAKGNSDAAMGKTRRRKG